MAVHRKPQFWFAAALLSLSSIPAQAQPVQVDNVQVDNLKEAYARFGRCWKPPPASQANQIDITVIVTFTRAGEILGHPKVTYESEQATDNDRLHYRVAVMEALQRCAPMPFTEGMGGAVAGRPLVLKFHHRKPPPQPTEKSAWLKPTIL